MCNILISTCTAFDILPHVVIYDYHIYIFSHVTRASERSIDEPQGPHPDDLLFIFYNNLKSSIIIVSVS